MSPGRQSLCREPRSELSPAGTPELSHVLIRNSPSSLSDWSGMSNEEFALPEKCILTQPRIVKLGR